jgi:hypothetical protein
MIPRKKKCRHGQIPQFENVEESRSICIVLAIRHGRPAVVHEITQENNGMRLHSIYRRVPAPPEVEINNELAQGFHQEVTRGVRAAVSDLRICYH